MSKRDVYRILDAAANRGREALRVVEDAARFLDDNKALATALKEARHRFAAAAEKLDRRERLLARDTPNDVGTEIETSDEYRRATLQEVLAANFARLQEAARSLEEFSKLVEPQLAKEWERVRYDAYSLEKLAFETAEKTEGINAEAESDEEKERALAQATTARLGAMFAGVGERSSLGARRRSRLSRVSLRVSVDRALFDDDAFALFRSDIGAFQFSGVDEKVGADLLRQWDLALRDKASGARPLLFARAPRVWCDAFDGLIVDLRDAELAREEFGPDVLIGVQASTFDEVESALQFGALGAIDLVDVGPVFASRQSDEPTSVVFLRTIGETFGGKTSTPIFAFGGIDSDNYGEVFDSGIERIVVGSSILDAPDKLIAAMRLRCLT